MAVQTETYANIVERVEALMGDDLTTRELTRLKALINRRARYAYKLYDNWPSFFRYQEPRRVRAGDLIRYEETDGMYDDDIDTIYRATFNNPSDVGLECEVDGIQVGSDWQIIGSSLDLTYYKTGLQGDYTYENLAVNGSGTITAEHDQETYAEIGDSFQVNGVEDQAASPVTVDGVYAITGVQPGAGTTAGILVSSGAISGLSGALTVDESSSGWWTAFPVLYVTYKVRLPGAYGDDAGETSTVPHEWAEYLVQGGYSDFLRADGQGDKAGVEERMAQEVLNEEMLRIDRTLTDEHHRSLSKVRTHGTQAFR